MKKVRPQTYDTKAVRRIDRRTFVKQTAAASAVLAAGTAFLGGQPPAYAIGLACSLGADAALQKPVDNDAFLAEIDSLTRQAA